MQITELQALSTRRRRQCESDTEVGPRALNDAHELVAPGALSIVDDRRIDPGNEALAHAFLDNLSVAPKRCALSTGE